MRNMDFGESDAWKAAFGRFSCHPKTDTFECRNLLAVDSRGSTSDAGLLVVDHQSVLKTGTSFLGLTTLGQLKC